MSENPIIFISHASSPDGTVAIALKKKIEEYFRYIEVFETSSDETIPSGEDWLPNMLDHLDRAQALVVIISPVSRYSEWVHFEIGYFSKINEDRKREGKEKLPIYPLTIDNEQIFDTIKHAQGKSLSQRDSLQEFFKALSKRFECRENIQFDVDDIVALCDTHNYSDLLISHSNTFKAKEYSDDEIIDKLREYLEDEYRAFVDPIRRAMRPIMKHKKNLFEGRSMEYEMLDRKLEFHSGKSRVFLSNVASEYGLIPELNGEYRIQFRYEPSQNRHLHSLK